MMQISFSLYAIPLVHQHAHKLIDQLLIDFIYKFDLWHGVQEELKVLFVILHCVRGKILQ